MSSSFDNVECPVCGSQAMQEQDNQTLKTYTHCPDCGYDSDIPEFFEDYDDDYYEFDDDWDGGDIIDDEHY